MLRGEARIRPIQRAATVHGDGVRYTNSKFQATVRQVCSIPLAESESPTAQWKTFKPALPVKRV